MGDILAKRAIINKRMNQIWLQAPAKINLGLAILGKLNSGYHEVKFIFSQVSLFDRIQLKEIPTNEIKIICNDQQVPTDKINTVYQAALLLKKMVKTQKGLEIKIDKQIPVAAGLGGGSSDAAQALIGINKLWNVGLNTTDLIKVGFKIGVDVCYQLVGGTKLATHLGEKLNPLPNLPQIHLVLTNPNIEVSTKWAYTNIDYSQIGKNQLDSLIDAVKNKDVKKIAKNLHNDFEFWVPNLVPVILKIKKKMLKQGALGAIMSGSGPTVFGVCENKAVALKVYNSLKKEFPKTYLAQTI